MKTSMVEYSKIVLKKVSFNRGLFWKEYRKFKKALSKQEHLELRQWVQKNYLTLK